MPFFRFPQTALIGYFTGTFVLAAASVIIGEYSIQLAFRVNKEKIVRNNIEISHYQDLSFAALKAGDKIAFKASNSIANDAFGKAYFSQISLSAASLWPAFIALGWMQYRFSEVEFSIPLPLTEGPLTIGYTATFILCYILSRIAFQRIKRLV